MGVLSEDGTGLMRRGCSCSKEDFLPEESFKSWGNYVNALNETPSRFMDRVLTRSADQVEMEAKSRSHNEMKKTLTWWDLMWFGMGAVIGAGIFVLTGLEAREHAGPAVLQLHKASPPLSSYMKPALASAANALVPSSNTSSTLTASR